MQSKMLLPTYDVFDEMRNFAPARTAGAVSSCGKQMALTICEDAWNDKNYWTAASTPSIPSKSSCAGRRQIRAQISSSPFWVGKRELRREMLAPSPSITTCPSRW